WCKMDNLGAYPLLFRLLKRNLLQKLRFPVPGRGVLEKTGNRYPEQSKSHSFHFFEPVLLAPYPKPFVVFLILQKTLKGILFLPNFVEKHPTIHKIGLYFRLFL